MNNWKTLALVGLLSGGTTLAGYKLFVEDNSGSVVLQEAPQPSAMAKFTSAGMPAGAPGDFTYAAEASTPAVVHIRSSVVRQGSSRQQSQLDFFRDFFGDGFPGGGFGDGGSRRQEGTGSGVIITSDGYIVTNNHVVEGATELEVTLQDKTRVPAKLIGADPSTDIAVIKIENKNLPAAVFGNSDAIRVGEWVVAVGNPFNLETTVTAGIVSAKGRGLGIIGTSRNQRRNSNEPQVNDAIESFIQTDAVVNPGNSGGALVNLKGELIGINTAIASPTGSYAGYAFAVPSSIVKKVSSDLIKFGNAQRGYLGVTMQPIDNKIADEKGLKVSSGVLVNGLAEKSAAEEAGIKPGDVIVKVGPNKVATVPDLTQAIALHRPGDKVNVTVNRDGKEKEFTVTLKNKEGGSGVIKKDESAAVLEALGATLGNLTKEESQRLSRYKIDGGVRVEDVGSGKLARRGVEPGFVITKINDQPVKSVNDVVKALAGKVDSMVQFEGLYLDAPYDIYTFGFRL